MEETETTPVQGPSTCNKRSVRNLTTPQIWVGRLAATAGTLVGAFWALDAYLPGSGAWALIPFFFSFWVYFCWRGGPGYATKMYAKFIFFALLFNLLHDILDNLRGRQ